MGTTGIHVTDPLSKAIATQSRPVQNNHVEEAIILDIMHTPIYCTETAKVRINADENFTRFSEGAADRTPHWKGQVQVKLIHCEKTLDNPSNAIEERGLE